jgi:hypothetical protein
VQRRRHVAVRRAFASGRESRSPLFGANTANTRKVGPRTRSERSPNAPVFAPVPNCSRSRKAVGARLVEDLRKRGRTCSDQHPETGAAPRDDTQLSEGQETCGDLSLEGRFEFSK